MYKIKLDLYGVINKLEGQNRRRYSISDIAEGTGLHRHTIRVMLEGKTDETLSKVVDFFVNEGMPIAPNDLFSIAESDD